MEGGYKPGIGAGIRQVCTWYYLRSHTRLVFSSGTYLKADIA
jgi:hypothetical protein